MLLDWVSLKHASGRSIGLENMDAQVTLKIKGKRTDSFTHKFIFIAREVNEIRNLFEIIREIRSITK